MHRLWIVPALCACCVWAEEPSKETPSATGPAAVEQRVDALERESLDRLRNLEERLSALEQRFDRLIESLGREVERRSSFDSVERQLRNMERKLDRVGR